MALPNVSRRQFLALSSRHESDPPCARSSWTEAQDSEETHPDSERWASTTQAETLTTPDRRVRRLVAQCDNHVALVRVNDAYEVTLDVIRGDDEVTLVFTDAAVVTERHGDRGDTGQV